MISISSPIREKSHPDEFPILCCFGSVPTLITNEAVARSFLKRMEEARQRLEKAIQIEHERKGGVQ